MHIGNRSTRTLNQRTESSGSVHGGALYCSIAWIARASEDHARRAKRSKRSSSAFTSSKLKSDSFDVDLLAEVDDEYWCLPSSDGSPAPTPRQPADVPSRVAFFSAAVRLNPIVGSAMRKLYSVNKSTASFGPKNEQWHQAIVLELGMLCFWFAVGFSHNCVLM